MQSSAVKDLNGSSLNDDLIYFSDYAEKNYRNFVQTKAKSKPFVPNFICVNDNEKREKATAATKPLLEVRHQIFSLLEKLPPHARQTFQEVYKREVQASHELHVYLDFYNMAIELDNIYK